MYITVLNLSKNQSNTITKIFKMHIWTEKEKKCKNL